MLYLFNLLFLRPKTTIYAQYYSKLDSAELSIPINRVLLFLICIFGVQAPSYSQYYDTIASKEFKNYGDTLNWVDQYGLKQGLWVIYKTDTLPEGTILDQRICTQYTDSNGITQPIRPPKVITTYTSQVEIHYTLKAWGMYVNDKKSDLWHYFSDYSYSSINLVYYQLLDHGEWKEYPYNLGFNHQKNSAYIHYAADSSIIQAVIPFKEKGKYTDSLRILCTNDSCWVHYKTFILDSFAFEYFPIMINEVAQKNYYRELYLIRRP